MSFNRLKEIIGPAPSEMSLEALHELVKREKARVTKAIALWEKQVMKEKATPKKSSKKAEREQLARLLKESGLTEEAFLRFLKQRRVTNGSKGD